jgi:glutamate--cysteine ligase
MPVLSERLDQLKTAKNLAGLADLTRGVEKESLRVNRQGTLSRTTHPKALGAALTHPHITTDYSEALLEFITPPEKNINHIINTLEDLHTFTYQHIGDESLWVNSMPCILNDDDVPIAQYGDSNSGRMKSIYRLGLGHRYGRSMQTIAGIHFNFSVSDDLWEFLHRTDASSLPLVNFKTDGYLKLIRNFRRNFWLLLYLFGAAPAVCSSFIKGREHTLEPLKADDSYTLYTPYATSLRMGDLGYQSSAQESLMPNYNNIDDYIKTLCDAITQQHTDYSAIDIRDKHGDYQQLNDCLLQIENEFYSIIRPKRTAKSGQTALSALANGGIEYIEVRCLDLNPFEDIGINKQQIQFLDIFLLYCLLEDSPPSDEDENRNILENQKRMVYEGRKPNLMLHDFGRERPAEQWSQEIMGKLQLIAEMIDTHNDSKDYQNALKAEQKKLDNSAHTPSAKIVEQLTRDDISFHHLAMNHSLANRDHFRSQRLSADKVASYTQMATESLAKQKHIEADTSIAFDKYLENYYKQYICCTQ